jgi:magnesium-transporting ATPase (P-type)
MAPADRIRQAENPAGEQPWHAMDQADVLAEVGTNENGLTSAEAASRLATLGPNRLPQQQPPAWWQILLRQFLRPLIYLLGFALLISLFIGDVNDAAFIAFVVAINAAIGGYQEWREERTARALQQLLRVRASVVRDGQVREVDAEKVVPGDVVWVESGNRVPADVWLLTAHGLEVDESLLAGESLAVLKQPGWRGEACTPVSDRRNMAYAGSTIVRGRGKGVVVATGPVAVVGQLALDVAGSGGAKPPLIVRMERFNHAIAVAVVMAAVTVALIGILAYNHPSSRLSSSPSPWRWRLSRRASRPR